MEEYIYNVVLATELGNKSGTMRLFVNKTKISGFLSILKHTEPFYGYIDTDGITRLHGKIVTLIKEISYTASGKITKDSLTLNLQLEKSNYILRGITPETAINN